MDITQAKKEVSDVYKSLNPIVKDVVGKHAKEIDNIIAKIKKDLTTLTNKELQDYMLQLSIETYYYNFKESLLDAVVDRFKKSSLLEDKYREIANLDIMINYIVNLIEQEKEYKKGVKKGYPTYVRATDGFHILGYYTRQLAADVKKDEYYQSFLEKCNATMFKDWNKQVNIYYNIENFNIY